jgi:ribosomal protein L12E/L44/L45/RPP1/RPP2
VVNSVVPHESVPLTASAPGAVSDASQPVPSLAPAGGQAGQERQEQEQEQEQEQDDNEDQQ